MKKILAIILVLLMVPFTFTGCGSIDKCQFELNEDGQSYTLVGVGENTKISSIVIDKYQGLPITAIGPCAFQDCTKLKSVTIGDSVKTIGAGAFDNCYRLKTVDLGNGVESIGGMAFMGTLIETVTLPNSLKVLCDDAFLNCRKLTSISIPDSVTSIGRGAFQGCHVLENVTIGSGVTHIGGDIFGKGPNFGDRNPYLDDESKWEDGVLYIGEYLINASNTVSGEYKIKDGTKVIADYAFAESKIESIVIPSSVKYIGASAFSETSLETVEIPDTVELIGKEAFRACKNLSSATVRGGNISDRMFYDCKNLANVIIDADVEETGEDVFVGCPLMK